MAKRDEAGQNRVPMFRSARKPTVPLAPQSTVNNYSECLFDLSNPKIEHTSGGSGRRGARRSGRAGLDGVPTGRVAKKPTVPVAPRGIVNNIPQALVASTNKENPT